MQTQLLYKAANAVGLFAACAPFGSEPARAESVISMDWQKVPRPIDGNAYSDRVFRAVDFTRTEPHIALLRAKFSQLRGLRDGWSGGNSVRPKAEALRAAGRYLDQAFSGHPSAIVPAIVPVPDGGVQAEWYSDAARFEVYFEPSGEILAWAEDRSTGAEREAEGVYAVQMLVDWVASSANEATVAG